jgi:hypothetical protein
MRECSCRSRVLDGLGPPGRLCARLPNRKTGDPKHGDSSGQESQLLASEIPLSQRGVRFTPP